MAVEWLRKDASGLGEAGIHVDDAGECVEEDVVRVSSGTTVIVFFREVPRDEDDVESEDGPFMAGGAITVVSYILAINGIHGYNKTYLL